MIQAIIGILFVFVIPGFLLTQIFFKKEKILEKLFLTVLLSITFTVVLGLLLGFNELTFRLTGGLHKLWVYVIILNVILLGIYVLKQKKLIFK